MSTSSRPEITVVVAAFNEEENVGALYREVKHWLSHESFELVIVDDGSSDRTADRVQELRDGDRCVRLVRLARNYGVQAALLAGIKAARGRAIITLDCDLQHPPSLLPSMIRVWREGARIVVMRRVHYDENVGWRRLWASRTYAWLVSFLSGDPYAGKIGDFLLLDRRARTRLLKTLPPRPYIRMLIPWLGFRMHFLPFKAAPRHAGPTRFSFGRLLRLALDGVLTCSTRPLRISFYLGLITIAVVSAYAVVAAIASLLGHSVPGYPTIIITLALLGSIQLIGLGILGEYLGRVYDQVRGVPPFIIQEDTIDTQTISPSVASGAVRFGDAAGAIASPVLSPLVNVSFGTVEHCQPAGAKVIGQLNAPHHTKCDPLAPEPSGLNSNSAPI
jgi:polyisoprenyl-phosphate glycosyltransferase